MTKILRCRDTGPDCSFEVCAETEEEILKYITEHFKAIHNIQSIPNETITKTRSLILSGDWISDTEQLLSDWHRRIREGQFAHYVAANHCGGWNYWLGIPAALLSTFVGTTIFATLEQQVDPKIKIVIGLVSVLTALLASLQTFLRLAERAEKHRVVAARFGSLRRMIEEIHALPRSSRGNAKDFLSTLRNQYDTISAEAPEIHSRVWRKAQIQMSDAGYTGLRQTTTV